uniref:Tyrosine-protein kinase ephrin type A/B receptor-like domain-containing protein n=1 Tax=Emiliania huxleyi TaxID=2903 RepID=A0A7S3TEN2_EMIHU
MSGLSECTPCEGGTYQNNRSATVCLPCEVGSYCAEGASSPLPCKKGTFSSATNLSAASECVDASPGHFATTGSTEQTPCAKGSYTDEPKQDKCTPCAAGTYQDEEGKTACLQCQKGSYCPHGAAASLPCPAGKHIDHSLPVMMSIDDCIMCPAGTFCPPGSDNATECAPGSNSSEGAGACVLCPPGYSSNRGNESCYECPAGSYAETVGSAQCSLCPPGEISERSGSVNCTICGAGTFSGSSGGTACEICPAGGYCEAESTASCGGGFTPCPSGTFNPLPGNSSEEACMPCPSGTTSPQPGQTNCSVCEAGTYSRRPDGECVPCRHPMWSGRGSDICDICMPPPPSPPLPPPSQPLDCPCLTAYPAGVSLVSDELQVVELHVVVGGVSLAYNGTYGLHACGRHDSGLEPSCNSTGYPDWCEQEWCYVDNATCNTEYSPSAYVEGVTLHYSYRACGFSNEFESWFYQSPPSPPAASQARGFYLVDPPSGPPQCDPCPPNANCAAFNTTLATLGVPRGYWRASLSSAVLTECRSFGGDNNAGERRCAGSDPVGGDHSSGRTLHEVSADYNETGYCAIGFTGPECQLCDASNHYLVDGDTCRECAAVGLAMGRLAGVALGLCAACALLAWAYSMQSWRHRRYIGAALRLTDRFVAWCVAIGLQAKAKILLGFYQVVIVLSTTYSARLPEKYTGWTDKLSGAVSVDWSGILLPSQCVNFSLRLLTIALSPVGLIALLLLIGVLVRIRRWQTAPERPRFSAAVRSGILDLTPSGLILIFCFVPSVSASIFRSWSCKAYVVSPPYASFEQISYMRQDASVQCDTAEHDSITTIAIFLIFLWPFGSLALFTLLLIPCHKALSTSTPTDLSRAASFLHREYEVRWYWWEALDLLRKIILTGVVVLIPEKRSFVRLVLATLICSCYTVGLAVATPFKRIEDDVLAVAINLVLLLMFLGASWTTLFDAIEESCEGKAESILGWGSSDVIVISMSILVGFALALFLIGAVLAARRVAKIKTIRLKKTKQAPELTLAKGLTWHLFNSHIWSTGQDAAAVIKKVLMLLLPGIQVFLDVDDLEDIGALESYIARSQVILFFLSKGYLRSKNCLREIRSSLELKKPIILVQEADPEKGGGSLKELREECPEGLQSAIFDANWPQIVWMRIEEFQIVSLKMISEALLLQTPAYASLKTLPLKVPGELERQRFGFVKPVILWASPANPGARDLANELATTFPGLRVSRAAVTPKGPPPLLRSMSSLRAASARQLGRPSAGPPEATHMLLYLCEATWLDERLEEQVKAARDAGLPIVMAHEKDPDLGGCAFARFFETTPQELVAGGLYRNLAISCFSGRHRKARGRHSRCTPTLL